MRRILAALLILTILLPSSSWAAIVIDSARASIAHGFTSTTLVWSHVVASGTDQVLFVCTGAGSSTSATTDVSSVTFGADSLTKVTSSFKHDGWDGVTLWYKINPTVQTANITITYGGSANITSGIAAAFTGVHQTTPVGTAATASGTSTAPAVTVTSASGEVVIGCLASDSGTGITENGTLIKEQENVEGDTSYGAEYYSGSASVNVQWAQAENTGWAITGVSIKPVSAAADQTFGFLKRRPQ